MIFDNRLNFMQSLLANQCLLCGAASGRDICAPCYTTLPHLPPHHCLVCALPLPTAGVCGACLAHPPGFDHSIAAASYAFPIDALLQSLKYQANLALATLLADLLSDRIDAAQLPDFILPMP